MKIAITGKGGVGKTTVSGLLTTALGLDGRHVIALDADPDANLASALGLPADQQPTALAEMKELIAERTGAKEGYGGFFKLNPRVDDLPEKHAAKLGNVHLLVLGGVKTGGGGCICPESALAKALLTHLVLSRDEVVLMDMEAGLEHLGRATGQSMDGLVVVVDDGPWSIQTALRIRSLAADIGLERLFAVANRITEPDEVDRVREGLDGIPLIGHLPYDKRFSRGVSAAGPDGRLAPGQAMTDHLPLVKEILGELEGRL